MAENRIMKKHKAWFVVCGDCDFSYKTTNDETKKCIECGSRNILSETTGDVIRHSTLVGDDETNEE